MSPGTLCKGPNRRPSRIIDPLTSRCAKFRFTPVQSEDGIKRLNWIANCENVMVDDDKVLTHLLERTNGDLRQAINLLQSGAASLSTSARLTAKMVDDMVGLIPKSTIDGLCKILKSGTFKEALETVDTALFRESYSPWQALLQLSDSLMDDRAISDQAKAKVMQLIGAYDARINGTGSRGGGGSACEFIHLRAFLGEALRALHAH